MTRYARKDENLASFWERLRLWLRKVTELSTVSKLTLKSRAGAGTDHEESWDEKIFGSPNAQASKLKSGSKSLKIDKKIEQLEECTAIFKYLVFRKYKRTQPAQPPMEEKLII